MTEQAQTQPAPHQLPGQSHAADPKAEAAKDPANQLPTSSAPQAKPRAVMLGGTIKESQYVLKEFTVFIPKEHTPDMLLEPTYWTHQASRLSINDKLDCIHDEWECTLRVANKGPTWVKMRALSITVAKPGEGAEPLRDQYAIEWAGPSAKHRIVHKDTKRVISDGHQTKDAARAALDAHLEIISKR